MAKAVKNISRSARGALTVYHSNGRPSIEAVRRLHEDVARLHAESLITSGALLDFWGKFRTQGFPMARLVDWAHDNNLQLDVIVTEKKAAG